MKSGKVKARTASPRIITPCSAVGAFLAVAIGVAVISVSAATPAFASGLQLFSETFANNTVPTSEVVLPDLPAGIPQAPPSEACLTAGGTPSGASAIPQCSGASDPNGSGSLRFTDTGESEEGGVFSATSLPATQGLDVTFDSYQFGGTGADGIAFALAMANPTDPRPPSKIGYSGGSLGYAPNVGEEDNGLSYGYLGVGLDAFGNFSTSMADGSDCAGEGDSGSGSRTPEAVSVRGPGNGDDGYCLVGGPWTDGSDALRASTATAVPVEVAINPTGSAFTTGSGLSVSAFSYAIRWTPVGGTQQTQTGDLPDLRAAQYSDLEIPSSYYNSSGIPYQMTFGWVASTGGSTDYHEVRNVVVSNGTGSAPPTFALATSDNKSGEFGQGTSVQYTFTPSLSQASEAGTVTFTDPFPAGLTPTSTAGTDLSWSCSIAGSTVTCTHAGVSSPSTLPNIDIAASVASNASTASGALDDRGYVSADDSLDADALDVGTAYGPATVTSLGPDDGLMTGGTEVGVIGTNFNNVSSVNVGSATVAATCSGSPPFSDCFIVNSPTAITLYTPTGSSAGGPGPVNVTVTNDAGTGSGSTYTYVKAPSTTTVSSSQNPSVSGQAVSFTADVTPGATGSVTFTITQSHGSAVSCAGGDDVPLSGSNATCSILADSLLAAGSTYGVSANYGGDNNYFTSSGSLDPAQTVNLDATTTATPTSTVDPSVYGQTVTYATTVSSASPGAGTPTGFAVFEETVGGNTTTMCAGTLNGSGTTSCTSSALPPAGIASVQAVYLGDANYSTSTSSGLPQFVDPATTSTGLSSNLSPSNYGQPVTFTATVGVQAPGGGTPAGYVAFSADGSQITGCSNVGLNGSAQATCTTSSLSVASHTVVATYGGNADYLSSSGTLIETVGQQVTATSETSSVNPSVTGQSVTVTATVSYSGSGTPTGNVTFTITPASGAAPQCSGGDNVALNASSAVCTLILSAGSGPYHVQAEYDGDSNFDTSASSPLIQDVTPASTTTSVSTSTPNAVTDQAITFSATVAAVSPGGGVPGDGTVGFDVNGVPVAACASRSVTAGEATCTVSDLDVSGGPDYLVSAFYSGASDYSSSNDAETPLVQVIAPDATTTSLTSDTNPSTYGQNVNFTATVTPDAPGGGTPTGTVTISSDGSALCSGPVDSGELTCSSSTLSAGTHRLSATYTAGTDYLASTSSTLTQGVNQSATTTTVTSSDNPSSFGESVTLTATVAPVAPGQGTPTGLVDFSNGIVPICVNVSLSDGIATCTINYPLGSYTIVAAYRGSAGFIQSSGQMIQVVQKAATISSVVSAPTVVTGQGASYQAEVSVASPGSTELANLTGTVQIYGRDAQDDPMVALCSTAVVESGATVSCTSYGAVAAGSPWSITAVYSGDANFDASTSTAVTQTVNQAATSTAVTAVVNPSVTGQTITATAVFTIDSPGSDNPAAPTGTVEFEISTNGGTSFEPIAACETQPSTWDPVGEAGSATCTLPSPPAVSSVELVGVYSGDANFLGSTSPPYTQVVNQASTSTTIGVDTNPSVSGETVNYSASVTVNPPGSDSTSPTGTVDFQSSTNEGETWSDIPDCSAQGLSWNSETHAGSAACAVQLPATASGTEVQAVYSGDSNFSGSTSATPVTQEVNQAGTSISVALDPETSVSGETFGATATLSITAPGSDTPVGPTGTVDFEYSTNDGDTWSTVSGCTTQELSWDSESHAGTASCDTAFDADSSPIEIRGVYSGDENFTLSTSPSETETVDQASTTTSLDATPTTSVSGQTVGLDATVSISEPGSDVPAGPSGTVEFEYSTNGGDTWSAISGCATQQMSWSSDTHTGTSSCDTAFAATASGVKTLAVYSGDANFDASTSTAVTQTVNQAATSTAVTAVVNPSVTGQTITATAVFTIDSPGSDNPAAPTGTVEFEISTNGGTSFEPIAACETQPSTWDPVGEAGSATCTLPSPPAVSSVELVGVYSGDANFLGSTSPPYTQVVNQASTSTTIGVDTNPSVSGETVNYSASVTVNPPGSDSTSPTGAVDFQSSTNEGETWSDIPDCSAQGLSWNSETHAGSAACAVQLPATASGTEVQAVYSGDSNFSGSTSATPVTQEVNQAGTSISVALDPETSVSGETFGATATLSITAPGSDTPVGPTGTVDFEYSTNDGDTWSTVSGCTTQELSWDSESHAGTASCDTAFDADSSPIEIRGVYSGDENFTLSTSPSETETVDQASTTTSLDATPTTSVSGQTVGLDATVSISEPGSDVPAGPSGTVEFEYSTNGGDTWSAISGCATQQMSWSSDTHTGTSSCDTAFAATASGVKTLAVYSGDANFDASTSTAVTQTVNQAATSTAVDSSANPAVSGQTVTVDATMTIDAPGSDIPMNPAGTITFETSTDSGDTWNVVSACSAETLSWSDSAHQGTAHCSLQMVLGQSGIQFRAGFSGNANFGASESRSVTQMVTKAHTSTVVTSAPNSSGPMQPVTFLAHVSVTAPGAGSPSGAVTFYDGGSVLCAAVSLGSSYSASCTSRIPISATQTIVATYSGNSELAGSSGSLGQRVRHGYWLLGADGGVFSFGNAQFHGSLPQIGYSPAGSGRPHELNAPLVGISSTVDGNGYWLVASDGGVFTFGDAKFYGSTGERRLNKPVVAMAVTPDGKGYWLVASDGGVFTFGDAKYHGSTGAMRLNRPIVGMAVAPDGNGYWLVASDGGVFAFGSAHYFGSPSKDAGAGVVVGLAPTSNGEGYWIANADGQVFSYGNAAAINGGIRSRVPVVGIDGTADGHGYWMVTSGGGIYYEGDAIFDGSMSGRSLQRPIVDMSGL